MVHVKIRSRASEGAGDNGRECGPPPGAQWDGVLVDWEADNAYSVRRCKPDAD